MRPLSPFRPPRFLACLPFTLKEEGGYSNDAHDPGGKTMEGIIQREYDRYRSSQKRDLVGVRKWAGAAAC